MSPASMQIFRLSSVSAALLLLLAQFVPGLGDDSSVSASKNETKGANHSSFSNSIGLKVLLVGLVLVSLLAFSVLLYKIWQKKKREEQHARLLKLFEEDDDLEVELGMRD